jgi:hypothetical protein
LIWVSGPGEAQPGLDHCVYLLIISQQGTIQPLWGRHVALYSESSNNNCRFITRHRLPFFCGRILLLQSLIDTARKYWGFLAMYLFGLHVVCICLACLIPSTWSLPRQRKHYEQQHYEKRNFNTIKSIYELTIYPNQLPILEQGSAGVPPGLFNENATGRVDPVGNFTGFDDSIEYFFALAPVPQTNLASTAITSIQITEFSSACENVAASVVYLFCNVEDSNSAGNGRPLAPLKEVSDKSIFSICTRSFH